MKLWRQLSIHSQVSFEALAVSYNSAFRDKSTSSKVKDIFEEYSTTKGKTLTLPLTLNNSLKFMVVSI